MQLEACFLKELCRHDAKICLCELLVLSRCWFCCTNYMTNCGIWKLEVPDCSPHCIKNQLPNLIPLQVTLGFESQAVDPGLYQQSCCKLNILLSVVGCLCVTSCQQQGCKQHWAGSSGSWLGQLSPGTLCSVWHRPCFRAALTLQCLSFPRQLLPCWGSSALLQRNTGTGNLLRYNRNSSNCSKILSDFE